jgi:hypothetical protein
MRARRELAYQAFIADIAKTPVLGGVLRIHDGFGGSDAQVLPVEDGSRDVIVSAREGAGRGATAAVAPKRRLVDTGSVVSW